MRKKKLFVMALVLLVVGVGIFLALRGPDAAVAVHVSGFTNDASGRAHVVLWLTNRSSGECAYFFVREWLSNSVWVAGEQDWDKYYVVHSFEAGTARAHTLRLQPGPERKRLLIRCGRSITPWESKVNVACARFGLREPFPNNRWNKSHLEPIEYTPR